MNYQFRLLALLLLLFAIQSVTAQKAKLDSLENCLKVHKVEDTTRVDLLIKTAGVVYMKDSVKAFQYTTEAAELSGKLNFKEGLVRSYYLTGVSHLYNKSYKRALEYFLKALKFAEEIKNSGLTCRCLRGLGDYHNKRGEIQKAIEYYQKGITIADEQIDKIEKAKCLMNLSSVYFSQFDMNKALQGYHDALKLTEKLNEKSLMKACLRSLGVTYSLMDNSVLGLEFDQRYLKVCEEQNDKNGIFNGLSHIGNVFSAQKDYPKALEYFQKALNVAKETNNNFDMAAGYTRMGQVYQKTKDVRALEYLKKALQLGKNCPDSSMVLMIRFDIGNVYFDQADYEKALDIYSKSLKSAESLKNKNTVGNLLIKIGTVYLRKKNYATALSYTLKCLELGYHSTNTYQQLSEIYSATNDYKNAFIFYKLYKEKSDSIYNEKNVKKIAELEYSFKFEKEKQALELEQQKKNALFLAEKKRQKIVIFSLCCCFLLVSTFAVYVYRSLQAKHKTHLLLLRQKNEIDQKNEDLMQSNTLLSETKKMVEERENLLIQITDNIPISISLVNKNLDYQFANNTFAEIFDQPKQNIPGKNVKDILKSTYYEEVYPNISEALAGRVSTIENVLEYNGGKQHIVQTTYLPYYQNDTVRGVLGCSQDITERKKAEEALRESEIIKKKLLTNEIERINQELESNHKSLTAATLKLIQNSERDTQTINQLMELENYTTTEGKQKIKALLADNKRVSYNSNWGEFEILFEKVHRSFYEKLNTQFPTLTANERKMCAFLKLNMSTKDIAQITFQTDEALRKSRMRLRQKFGITRDTNLGVFLQNI